MFVYLQKIYNMELNNLVSAQLHKIADDLDSGNSIISKEHADLAMDLLMSSSDRNLKLSKYQACQYLAKQLNTTVSRAKFDNLVSEGRLPKGKKQAGFKELF
jgi:hypothetical protein